MLQGPARLKKTGSGEARSSTAGSECEEGGAGTEEDGGGIDIERGSGGGWSSDKDGVRRGSGLGEYNEDWIQTTTTSG